MGFDNQAVRAGRDSAKANGVYETSFPSCVRWVRENWKVGQLLYRRDRVNVERVSSVSLERSDAALAQDDLIISLARNVFGGLQPLLDRRCPSALQHHGLSRAPDF